MTATQQPVSSVPANEPVPFTLSATFQPSNVRPSAAGDYAIVVDINGDKHQARGHYTGGTRGRWSTSPEFLKDYMVFWVDQEELPNIENLATPSESLSTEISLADSVTAYQGLDAAHQVEVTEAQLLLGVQKLHLQDALWGTLHVATTVVPSIAHTTEDEQASAARLGAAILSGLITRQLVTLNGNRVSNTELGHDVALNGFDTVVAAS